METTIARIQLNAHNDITNVVDHEELLQVVPPTLDTFIEQLIRICGPFSRNALIIKADENLSTAIGSEMDMRMFLRDGRHTLRSTEFVSPIQQYLKSIITYIGSRVDAVCKDGTTTSMLFACRFIRELLDRDFQKFTQNYSLKEIEETFKNLFTTILSILEKDRITVDDISEKYKCSKQDAASVIAYLQAYTASGGNSEIAEAIATYFKYSPEDMWGDRIEHTVSRVEKTGYVCKTEKYEYEYELSAILLTVQYRNMDMRTVLKLENADMLILSNGLLDSSFATESFVAYLEKRLEVDKNTNPLLICTPGGNYCSTRMVEFINAKAKEYNVIIPVVAYNVDTRLPLPWQAMTIHGKANVPVYMEDEDIDKSIIPNVTVEVNSNSIRFNNLVAKDSRMDENSIIHPGMIYPEDYPHWKKIKDIVEGYLVSSRSKHEIEPKELEALENAHADLSVSNRMILRLGGFYHDQLALQPIIEDAAGSAMAGIKDGIIINSIFKLRKMFIVTDLYGDMDSDKALHNYIVSKLDNLTYELVLDLYGPARKRVIDWIDEEDNDFFDFLCVFYKQCENNPCKYIDLLKDGTKLDQLTDHYTFQSIDTYIDHLVNGDYSTVANMLTTNGYPPIQTFKMFPELFSRIQEVAVKVAFMDMVIVPGAAWQKTNK